MAVTYSAIHQIMVTSDLYMRYSTLTSSLNLKIIDLNGSKTIFMDNVMGLDVETLALQFADICIKIKTPNRVDNEMSLWKRDSPLIDYDSFVVSYIECCKNLPSLTSPVDVDQEIINLLQRKNFYNTPYEPLYIAHLYRSLPFEELSSLVFRRNEQYITKNHNVVLKGITISFIDCPEGYQHLAMLASYIKQKYGVFKLPVIKDSFGCFGCPLCANIHSEDPLLHYQKCSSYYDNCLANNQCPCGSDVLSLTHIIHYYRCLYSEDGVLMSGDIRFRTDIVINRVLNLLTICIPANVHSHNIAHTSSINKTKLKSTRSTYDIYNGVIHYSCAYCSKLQDDTVFVPHFSNNVGFDSIDCPTCEGLATTDYGGFKIQATYFSECIDLLKAVPTPCETIQQDNYEQILEELILPISDFDEHPAEYDTCSSDNDHTLCIFFPKHHSSTEPKARPGRSKGNNNKNKKKKTTKKPHADTNNINMDYQQKKKHQRRPSLPTSSFVVSKLEKWYDTG